MYWRTSDGNVTWYAKNIYGDGNVGRDCRERIFKFLYRGGSERGKILRKIKGAGKTELYVFFENYVVVVSEQYKASGILLQNIFLSTQKYFQISQKQAQLKLGHGAC